MPKSKDQKPHLSVVADSQEQIESWKAKAKKSKRTLSSWVRYKLDEDDMKSGMKGVQR